MTNYAAMALAIKQSLEEVHGNSLVYVIQGDTSPLVTPPMYTDLELFDLPVEGLIPAWLCGDMSYSIMDLNQDWRLVMSAARVNTWQLQSVMEKMSKQVQQVRSRQRLYKVQEIAAIVLSLAAAAGIGTLTKSSTKIRLKTGVGSYSIEPQWIAAPWSQRKAPEPADLSEVFLREPTGASTALTTPRMDALRRTLVETWPECIDAIEITLALFQLTKNDAQLVQALDWKVIPAGSAAMDQYNLAVQTIRVCTDAPKSLLSRILLPYMTPKQFEEGFGQIRGAYEPLDRERHLSLLSRFKDRIYEDSLNVGPLRGELSVRMQRRGMI